MPPKYPTEPKPLSPKNTCPVCGDVETQAWRVWDEEDTDITCEACEGVKQRAPEVFDWVQKVITHRIEKAFEERDERARERELWDTYRG